MKGGDKQRLQRRQVEDVPGVALLLTWVPVQGILRVTVRAS